MYFFYDSNNFSVGMIYVEERNSIWYRIGTNAVVQYFDGTVNGTLLHYYHINFVVNIHVKNLGHILINDNFTVVSIVKSAFKEWNSTIWHFLKLYWWLCG